MTLSCKEPKKNSVPPITETSWTCSHGVVLRSGREIGFDILNTTQSGSFENNFIKAQELDINFIQILQAWNQYETSAGVYNGSAVSNLSALSNYALAKGVKLSIVITPIDIPGRFTPAYLNGVKFDNALMISAFNNFIDHLFTQTVNPSIVNSFSVGNEIDHYNWAGNGDSPTEYQNFLAAIKAIVNSYGIDLHFTGTLKGMQSQGSTYTSMSNVVDKVSVTYYPQSSSFIVNDPNVPEADLDSLVNFFPTGTDFFFQEVGYQTGSANGSSELKQAQFFCNFFKAWDDHKDVISAASILRFNDVSRASAESTAVSYGLPGNEAFIQYIQTLGIRTWEGNGYDKQSFQVIKSEIQKRNW